MWFIGGTPQMIGGVYIGCDPPTGLGGYAQGGTVAAPIFKEFAVKAYEGLEKIPFRAPAGIRMVRIDRRLGQAGVRRLADHRPQGGGDLGGVQAGERTAPRRAPRPGRRCG